MKIIWLVVKTRREEWAEIAGRVYQNKLVHFCQFEVVAIKSKSHGRDQAEQKIRQEEKQILDFIKPDDLVLIFDERGQMPKDSQDFAQLWTRCLESGKSRLVLVVGGAFGLGEVIKKRAEVKLSLSPLTMSHLVAQTCALEQIYRAFTIRHRLPYHNEN